MNELPAAIGFTYALPNDYHLPPIELPGLLHLRPENGYYRTRRDAPQNTDKLTEIVTQY